jgi:hypothetical protein
MGLLKYRIVRFNLERRGDIIKRQLKLPVNLKRCTGYLAKVTRGIGDPNDKPQIGLIALEFNSKKELAVNDVVGYECEARAKLEFQDLDVELNRGEFLDLLYIDQFPLDMQFTPYVVSVYLRCSDKINCPADV